MYAMNPNQSVLLNKIGCQQERKMSQAIKVSTKKMGSEKKRSFLHQPKCLNEKNKVSKTKQIFTPNLAPTKVA